MWNDGGSSRRRGELAFRGAKRLHVKFCHRSVDIHEYAAHIRLCLAAGRWRDSFAHREKTTAACKGLTSSSLRVRLDLIVARWKASIVRQSTKRSLQELISNPTLFARSVSAAMKAFSRAIRG
jgi:hypothetical protein